MKTVESCLEFCAASSVNYIVNYLSHNRWIVVFQSRCKAIVYERHEHICHYFLDDGSDSTIPSSGSVYLRVTGKECLGVFSDAILYFRLK
uniref:Apple domain-containing protein n=1 Tax=Syphacia muris TaxID=451379 RepID=A0A0N5AYU2_9BILA